MVETAAAEPCQPAAEEAQPDVTRLGIDVDGRHHAPREAVLCVGFLLFPVAERAGPLVVAGQAVFGADPDLGAVGLHGEDVVVGQPILHGELFPLRVDIGQFIVRGGCGRGPGNCTGWEVFLGRIRGRLGNSDSRKAQDCHEQKCEQLPKHFPSAAPSGPPWYIGVGHVRPFKRWAGLAVRQCELCLRAKLAGSVAY